MAWILAALLGSICWGISYALMDKVIHTINFWVYFLILYAISLPLIGLYIYYTPVSIKEEFQRLTESALWFTTIAGVLFVFVGNIFIFYAISRHNASEVNLIEITYPFFTCLVAWLVLKNYTPHWGFFVALTLILTGIATLYLTTPR